MNLIPLTLCSLFALSALKNLYKKQEVGPPALVPLLLQTSPSGDHPYDLLPLNQLNHPWLWVEGVTTA